MIVRRDVFPTALVNDLRRLLRREELFGPATVTGDASWRSARVAHIEHLPEGRAAAEVILSEIYSPNSLHDGPNVVDALGTWFEASRCEVQLSSYGDGDYFRTHNDNGTPDAAARRISWVAYLDPVLGVHPWGDGELLVDDGAGRVIVYTPADGEVVFFPSSALHEVRPVVAPPGWLNRRMSINGWIS